MKIATEPELVVAPEIYRTRAANNPIPFLVPETARAELVLHDPEEGHALAAAGQSYWSDVSEYQSPYTAAYPYPAASFRFHSGYRLDNNATANWNYHRDAIARGQTRVLIVYAVFIPGQLSTVLAGLHAVFGETAPTNRIAVMIDMESGNGFAGPGNHSAEANQWAQAFADWTGTSQSWARVVGYANHGDWQGNWPGVDPRLKDITAAYNNADPTPWAWQYSGGNPSYPVPAGAPRNAAPWTTSYVDMNLAHHTIDELEQQFEITAAPPTPEDDEMAQPNKVLSNGAIGGYLLNLDTNTRLGLLGSSFDGLQALKNADGSPMFPRVDMEDSVVAQFALAGRAGTQPVAVHVNSIDPNKGNPLPVTYLVDIFTQAWKWHIPGSTTESVIQAGVAAGLYINGGTMDWTELSWIPDGKPPVNVDGGNLDLQELAADVAPLVAPLVSAGASLADISALLDDKIPTKGTIVLTLPSVPTN